MKKYDIEYLIHDIIKISEDIVLLEFAIDMCHAHQPIVELANEQMQLLYINRDLSIQELMDLGE